MSDFAQQEISRMKQLVGDRAQVIGAVSGGVDSTVAAKLMKEAIGTIIELAERISVTDACLGDRFHAILVDTGMCPEFSCEVHGY